MACRDEPIKFDSEKEFERHILETIQCMANNLRNKGVIDNYHFFRTRFIALWTVFYMKLNSKFYL